MDEGFSTALGTRLLLQLLLKLHHGLGVRCEISVDNRRCDIGHQLCGDGHKLIIRLVASWADIFHVAFAAYLLVKVVLSDALLVDYAGKVLLGGVCC